MAFRRTQNPIEVIDLVSSDSENDSGLMPPAAPAGPLKRKRSERGDGDEVIIVSGSHHRQTATNPSAKKARIPIPGTLKFEKLGYGEANTDEITELPAPSDRVEPEQTEAAVDDDDDLVVLDTGNSTNAMAMPHSREDCLVKPFSKQIQPMSSNIGNKAYCSKCYCYVCEVLASLCTDWERHCDATHKNAAWKSEKAYASNTIYRIMSAADQARFRQFFEKVLFANGKYNDLNQTLSALDSAASRTPSDILMTAIIITSVFKVDINTSINRDSWGDVRETDGLPHKLKKALQLIFKAISDPKCPYELLKVLAEDKAAQFKEPLAKTMCSFLFSFFYRIANLDETATEERAYSAYLKEFMGAAAACHWKRMEATSPQSITASLTLETAQFLADLFKSSNNCAVSKLDSVVWLFTNARHWIRGADALLNSLNNEQDVEKLCTVVAAAVKSNNLTHATLKLDNVKSELGLFLLFGVMLTVIGNSTIEFPLLYAIYAALVNLVYENRRSRTVLFSDQPMPLKVTQFLDLRKRTLQPPIQWLRLYRECEDIDNISGKNLIVILVLQLVQYLPNFSTLYERAISPAITEEGRERETKLYIEMVRSVERGSRSLLMLKFTNECFMGDLLSTLLIMKFSIIYQAEIVLQNVEILLPHIRRAMQLFDELALIIFLSSSVSISNAVPEMLLLSLGYIPFSTKYGNLFATENESADHDLSIIRLKDERNPATFGECDILFESIMKISGKAVTIEESSWQRIGYRDSKQYFLTLCVKAIIGGSKAVIAPGVLLSESFSPHYESGTNDHMDGQIELPRKRFLTDTDYGKYLLIRIAERIVSMDPFGRGGIENLCKFLRWSRQTSFLIDAYLGKPSYCLSGLMSDASVWSFCCDYMDKLTKYVPKISPVYNVYRISSENLSNFGVSEEEDSKEIFINMRYIQLIDIIPPSIVVETELSIEQCTNLTRPFRDMLDIIVRLRNADNFNTNFSSGVIHLCSNSEYFVLQLFERGMQAIPNPTLRSAFINSYADAAIQIRSVTMMRVLTNQIAANVLMSRRITNPDDCLSLLKEVILSGTQPNIGSDVIFTKLQKLLYPSDSSIISASTNSSPQRSYTIGNTVNKVLGKKCEASCQWPDIRNSVSSFVFVSMASVKNISRSEIIMMLVVLGDFSKIKMMFQSWYSMSRLTERDTFIVSAKLTIRSKIESASMSELFFQIMLTAVGPEKRLTVLFELHHWIKWHYLCARAEEFEHRNDFADALNIIIDEFHFTSHGIRISSNLYELALLARPSLTRLRQLIEILSLEMGDNAPSSASIHEEFTRKSLIDMTSTVSNSSTTEFLNDDIAYTIVNYMLCGENAGACAEICVTFFSARQFKMMTACFKSAFFEMSKIKFQALSRGICRLAIWCSSWLSIPEATQIVSYLLSCIFEALIYPKWLEKRPEELTYIKETIKLCEDLIAGKMLEIRRDYRISEIMLLGDTDRRQISVCTIIPMCLRGLVESSINLDSSSLHTKNVSLLSFICEPRIEEFHLVNMTFLPPLYKQIVLGVLPGYIRISSLALQHDFKAIWHIFSEQIEEDRKKAESKEDAVKATIQNIKKMEACLDAAWFAGHSSDVASPILFMSFFDQFLINFTVTVNDLAWNQPSEDLRSATEFFFIKVIEKGRLEGYASNLLTEMAPLSIKLDFIHSKNFFNISNQPGCLLHGGKAKLLYFFRYVLMRSNWKKDISWKINAFSSLIGLDQSLDHTLCDMLFCDQFIIQIDDCTNPFDILAKCVHRTGVEAASTLELFVVLQLAAMTLDDDGKLKLLESEGFLHLLEAMSSRCAYLSDIITQYRGIPDVSKILRYGIDLRIMELLHTCETGNVVAIPAGFFPSVAYKIFCCRFKSYQHQPLAQTVPTDVDLKTHSLLNLLNCVLQKDSVAPSGFLMRINEVIPLFGNSLREAIEDAHIASVNYKNWIIDEDFCKIICDSDTGWLKTISKYSNFIILAVESENDIHRSLVEKCIKKAVNEIMLNRADAEKKNNFNSLLSMLQRDFFQSARMDSRWLNFYRELCRLVTPKPVLKKLVIAAIGTQEPIRKSLL